MSKEAHTTAPPDACADGEQSIALTRDFRLVQKRRGHRFSIDDLLVAHLACTRGGSPRRVLDLGCGLGSVLLVCAWAYRDAELVGLEILDEHAAYAGRNIRRNGCQARARVVRGDLRDHALLGSLGRFDLVTGSPPYYLPGTGTPCADPARAAAHFEVNGGIEEYAAAASRALTEGGLFVTCAGAEPRHRARRALLDAGLAIRSTADVLPRAGRKPFLVLAVAVKGPAGPGGAAAGAPTGGPTQEPPIVIRDADGRLTPQHEAIRAWAGIARRPFP